MPLEKPLRHGINNQPLRASQSIQAVHDLIHELPQCPRQMAAYIPLQISPFPLLLIQVRAVFASQIRCNQVIRAANARSVARLVWHEA